MKRLIIRQGERVIRHEFGDAPVTIGRDPKCVLFFSDQRLSRQHARVKASPAGVRFEDLGSRNGSYVDGKRVEALDLKPGDEVHLGGLVLSYEDDTPKPDVSEDASEDPTVMLEAGGSGEDATVMLESPAQPSQAAQPAQPAQEDKTVMLSSPPPEHTPKMIERAPSEPEPDAADQTLRLPDEPAPKPSGLPKTKMLDREALAVSAKGALKSSRGPSQGASDTMLLTADPPSPPPVEAPVPTPAPSERAATDAPRPTSEPGFMASWPWSAKLILIVSSVGLLVYLTLAYPLVRTLGSALREESLRRGRTLLSLAAASNGTAIGEGRIRDSSVDSVLREERVKDAFLLDLEGNVLAPSSRAGETLSSIDGIDAELADIRTFYLGRRGSEYVMVQPLLHRSQRVGLAVVVYEAATASGSWATAVLFLAFLVLLLGVVVALVMGKRMTLEPLAHFRDDIEAVVKGDAREVPAVQGFAELSELAKSVNRLIARAIPVGAPRSAPVASPAAPVPTPAAAPPKSKRAPSPPPKSAPVPPVASKRPVTAAVSTEIATDAARFWVDQNFIVVRADAEAAELVGAAGSGMEGKHLIEAVSEQKLLEVILDAVNALQELEAAETTAELPGGAIHVTATKDQGRTVVGLKRV